LAVALPALVEGDTAVQFPHTGQPRHRRQRRVAERLITGNNPGAPAAVQQVAHGAP
jgi:hypothetical protein